MKKIILLFSLVLLLTGCTIEKIDTSNKDQLITYMVEKDYNLYNRYSIGYKYYLPKTVSVLNYSDYNEQLLSNGNIYYLYVDVTSYFYKKDLSIDKDNNDVYYKRINKKNKKGYIKVTEYSDSEYYVKYQYNYAKIESIIDKKNLDETLVNMSYILTTIKYNDSIIENILNDSNNVSREEVFELDKPNNNESTFLDYVKAYDKYNKEDEDLLSDDSMIKESDEIND